MRQIQYLIGLTILIALTFGCKNQIDPKVKEVYHQAFTNNSTASNYVVFTAIDLQTNKSKEICCHSRSLIDAFIDDDLSHKDSVSFINSYNKACRVYDSILISSNYNPTFKFKKSESLVGIDFYNYDTDSVEYYSNQPDIAVLVESIKKNFNDTVRHLLIDYYKTDSRYVNHVLFKNGILCKNNCGTGYTIISKVLK